MANLVEGIRSGDTAAFFDELQRFKTNPSFSGRADLARKYPPQTHQVNEIWRGLPREEKAREVLLDHYQSKFKDLMDPGHYEFSARPLGFVPESGQAWKVADALLGGEFRGGTEQPFILNVRTHSMRLISEWGQRAIDLNLIPGEEPLLAVYYTINHNDDETKYANKTIKEAGPLIASEIFMNVVTSLPIPRSLHSLT